MTAPADLAIEPKRDLSGSRDPQVPALIREALQLPTTAATAGPRHTAETPATSAAADQNAGAAGPVGSPADLGTIIHRGVHDPTGQRQARQDAQRLRHLPNAMFVARIEHDCTVGPHLEWSIAGGTILAKSAVKGWILGKAGESLGPGARAGGVATGVAIGTVTGFYTAYETADLLENSCRAHAYEERLSQTQGGTQTESSPGLDPFSQTYEIERGFPSVRTVVDSSSDYIRSLLGKPHSNLRSGNYDLALAHGNLDDASYVAWAHRASAVPAGSQVERALSFASIGAAGGLFAASKLHLGWQGGVVAASGGALIGVGLSYLGVAAKEDADLADLLKARLMSKPYARPRP
jgi:hypothetical protein